jgi:hypothetical protein
MSQSLSVSKGWILARASSCAWACCAMLSRPRSRSRWGPGSARTPVDLNNRTRAVARYHRTALGQPSQQTDRADGDDVEFVGRHRQRTRLPAPVSDTTRWPDGPVTSGDRPRPKVGRMCGRITDSFRSRVRSASFRSRSHAAAYSSQFTAPHPSTARRMAGLRHIERNARDAHRPLHASSGLTLVCGSDGRRRDDANTGQHEPPLQRRGVHVPSSRDIGSSAEGTNAP